MSSLFLAPYLQLCLLASWGIAQNLEGLGLFAPFNSQPVEVQGHLVFPLNMNPAQGVAAIAMLLTPLLLGVILTSVRAGFYLGRKPGVGIVVLWVIPGILSILGLLPNLTASGPDVFRFGQGYSGAVAPAAANLFLFLAAGWSVVMMLGSFWKRDVFKNAYDHVWYALGLVAALYFVTDSGLSFYRHDLNNANERTIALLEVYAKSAQNVATSCETNAEVQQLAPTLCQMAPRLIQLIATDRELAKEVRTKIDMSDWRLKLLETPSISTEIRHLNAWACDGQNAPAMCLKFSPKITRDDIGYLVGHMFPPNVYLESLEKYSSSLKRVEEQIDGIERSHNIRYFAFLLVAFLAGGKVANASRALRSGDSVRPTSWILCCLMALRHTVRWTIAIVWFCLKAVLWISTTACRMLRKNIRQSKPAPVKEESLNE